MASILSYIEELEKRYLFEYVKVIIGPSLEDELCKQLELSKEEENENE